MKYLRLLSLVVTQLIFCVFCYGQAEKIDSLKKILPALRDTTRISCLQELFMAYLNFNADSAKYYATATYDESKKIDFFEGMATALLLQSWAEGHENFPLLERNSREAIQLYKKTSNTGGLSYAYNRLGYSLLAQSEYDEAIRALDTSIELCKKLNDTTSWINGLTTAGIANKGSGNYEKAFEKLSEGLLLSRQFNKEGVSVFALSTLGKFFTELEDYSTALEYYTQAYHGITPGKYGNLDPRNVVELAELHLKMQHYDSAKYYYGLVDTTKKRGLRFYLLGIPEYYFQMKEYEKALDDNGRGLKLHNESGDMNLAARALLMTAKIYSSLHKNEAALIYAWNGLELGRRVKSRVYIRDGSKILYLIYQGQQNSDSALFYYRQYVSMNDSILTGQVKGKLAAAGLSQKLELLNKEKEVQQAKLQRESTLKNIFIGSLFVLAILGFIIFRNIRLQRRNDKMRLEHELDLQKLEGEKAKSDLQKQAAELEMQALKAATREQLMHAEKMASLGELTSGIAHEIKNPLNFINNFSEINLELITEMEAEQIPKLSETSMEEVTPIIKILKKNSEKINHHGKRVDEIVRGMLQHSRAGNVNKELVNINALCEESLKLAWHGFRAKEKTFNASFETRFDPDLPDLMVFPQDLGRVMINLINNAFYTVHEKKKRNQSESVSDSLQIESLYKPSVIVSTKNNGNKILITVSDNGMGIPSPIMNKIFQPFFTTKPTGEGTGLGLSMSYDIISKSHGGEIRAKSKEGLGTDFEIILPV